jgi:nicotinamidase-related amidase
MGPGPLRAAALVISECQMGILDPATSMIPVLAAQAAERGIVAHIAELAGAFRAAGRPVVHCHIGHRADLAGMRPNSLPGALAIKHRRLIAGTPDTLPPPALAPQPADHVSRRATGLTAFYGTDLDVTLRLRSVETIVLTGVSTDVAIPGFALEAVNRGYYVRIPADCVAGTSAEAHAFMMGRLLPAVARITGSTAVLAGLGQVHDGRQREERNADDPTRLPRVARGDGGFRRVLDRRCRR